MPGKKRFASRADEALEERKAGLANAAKRRLGMGANQPGAKFAGKVSGGGTKAAVSFAANSKGRFTPRTMTGRPANNGPGNAAAVKLGEFGKAEAPGQLKKKFSS